MKKLVALMMALALALTFVCASAADYPAKEDNVSYNVMIRMRPMNGDADQMNVFTQMEEKTNVHINFEQIAQAEWDDKISLQLGAGVDLPDALYSGYSMDSANLVKYGSQGILISLNQYIDEYMPNFKKMLDEHPEVKAAITAPDGSIYSLPFVRYDGLTGKIPGNLFMNKTWLEKLNLKVPTTIEELETVLTAFKENDCNGNGEADEIPMTFKFLGSQRDLGSLFGMFGYADSLYDDTHLIVDDGKVIYVPTTEGYKEACKYLYEHFFSKGLIDLEGFTMDKATYNAQNQGEVANIGSFFAWNVFDLGQVHMDEYEAIAPMTGPDGKCSWYYNQTYGIEPVGLVITNACKNPEHLLQWADLCYDFYYGMQLEYGCIGETLIDNGDGTTRVGYLCYCLGNLAAHMHESSHKNCTLTAMVQLDIEKDPVTGETALKRAEYIPMVMMDQLDYWVQGDWRFRILDLRRTLNDYETDSESSFLSEYMYRDLTARLQSIEEIMGPELVYCAEK